MELEYLGIGKGTDYNKEIGIGYKNLGKEYKYANIGLTYADAIEFASVHSIYITIEPVFTFALKNKVGFRWKISVPDIEALKLKTVVQEDFSSFYLCLDEAIEKAFEMIYVDNSDFLKFFNI